jgi:hypothetical protein
MGGWLDGAYVIPGAAAPASPERAERAEGLDERYRASAVDPAAAEDAGPPVAPDPEPE